MNKIKTCEREWKAVLNMNTRLGSTFTCIHVTSSPRDYVLDPLLREQTCNWTIRYTTPNSLRMWDVNTARVQCYAFPTYPSPYSPLWRGCEGMSVITSLQEHLTRSAPPWWAAIISASASKWGSRLLRQGGFVCRKFSPPLCFDSCPSHKGAQEGELNSSRSTINRKLRRNRAWEREKESLG